MRRSGLTMKPKRKLRDEESNGERPAAPLLFPVETVAGKGAAMAEVGVAVVAEEEGPGATTTVVLVPAQAGIRACHRDRTSTINRTTLLTLATGVYTETTRGQSGGRALTSVRMPVGDRGLCHTMMMWSWLAGERLWQPQPVCRRNHLHQSAASDETTEVLEEAVGVEDGDGEAKVEIGDEAGEAQVVGGTTGVRITRTSLNRVDRGNNGSPLRQVSSTSRTDSNLDHRAWVILILALCRNMLSRTSTIRLSSRRTTHRNPSLSIHISKARRASLHRHRLNHLNHLRGRTATVWRRRSILASRRKCR